MHWDDVKGWMSMAAASPGVVLSDQVIQVVRMMIVAAVAWASVELISVSRSLAVMAAQVTAINATVSKLEASVEVRSLKQWSREDHQDYAEMIDRRLTMIEQRLNAQGSALANLQRPQR